MVEGERERDLRQKSISGIVCISLKSLFHVIALARSQNKRPPTKNSPLLAEFTHSNPVINSQLEAPGVTPP